MRFIFFSFLAVAGLVSSHPRVTGVWSSAFEVPVIAVAMANLPDGKVLMWAANRPDDSSGPVNNGVTWATIWDPENPSGSTAQMIDWTDHDSKFALQVLSCNVSGVLCLVTRLNCCLPPKCYAPEQPCWPMAGY